MVHQEVVRHQVGIERVVPRIDAHVDHHILRARNARVVDEVVDPTEGLERRVDRAL